MSAAVAGPDLEQRLPGHEGRTQQAQDGRRQVAAGHLDQRLVGADSQAAVEQHVGRRRVEVEERPGRGRGPRSG